MLRRKRKKNDESAPAEAGDIGTAGATPDAPEAGASDVADIVEPVAGEAGSPESPPDHLEETAAYAAAAYAEGPMGGDDDPAPDDHDPSYRDPSDGDMAPESAEAKQRRPRYQPAEVPLATPYGAEERLPVSYWMQSVQGVLSKAGTGTAEEREREAAAEFQAAIMPGLVGLRDAVPDAASPDEALRVLAQQEAEHEFPEDPEARSLTQNDIFQTDSSVYYRIRNRFEKPRRRVGWGDPWRPPPGLARPDPPRKALNRPD